MNFKPLHELYFPSVNPGVEIWMVDRKLEMYPAWILLSFSHDVVADRISQNNEFGEYKGGPCGAMCARHPYLGRFGLFFNIDYIATDEITHEVFHLTHRIMEWLSAEFTHEPYACLNGFLNKWVMRECYEHNTKIALS